MGTLPRLHIRMSSSWDRELATHADFLLWVGKQYSWECGCCCWRCNFITYNHTSNSFQREDCLQLRIEWRMSSTPQERWRYASTEGGRHAVYQDGSAVEKAWRPSQWKARSHAHSWLMHDMWRMWKHWVFREQLSWNPRECELHQQQQLSSSTESRMESAIKAKLLLVFVNANK